MQPTFTVFTSFSQCCMMEFEGAGVTEVYPESACASLIVIFPLGRLPPVTPLRLIYVQIPIVYNHQSLWIDLTSGLEISCLFCTLAYAFHTHPHTKQLCNSQPLADSIPSFSGLGASWARALSERCCHFARTPCSNSFCLGMAASPCQELLIRK